MNNRFYINLPESAEDKSVAALYRHAFNQLQSDTKDKEITLVAFNLICPYQLDDEHSVYVEYEVLNDEETHNRQQYRERTTEREPASPSETGGMKIEGGEIGLSEFRLPQGVGQDDDLKLVELFIEELRKLQAQEVLDCVFHEFNDEDALNHSYFRVYYKTAQSE
jgi:hypothetical protein